MMNPFKSPHYLKILRILLVLSLTAISCVSAYQYNKQLKVIYEVKKKIPFSFAGLKFSGLEKVFEDVEMIGYYTDKNFKKDEVSMQFAQAQLVLAPTILDLNNLEHKYILFDCSSERIAFAKIKEIGAYPLKRNQFGIILAKRIK